MEGWLNPGCTPEELAEGSKKVCQVYQTALARWEEWGEITISVDEKTGMQALERRAPDLPMRPGDCQKIEYEYERHGTLCLTANWDVLNGGIGQVTIQETRTEVDFEEHIYQTIKNQPLVSRWCFVLDNLNTHKSETLVRLVADLVGTAEEQLGVKEKSGILKNMETRARYLSNPEHPVYFVFTPKHCSWLNQIEIWFSILSRKLLRRGNFSSKQDLKEQVLKFIHYFNKVLAKPFEWNYGGKPCTT